MQDVWFLCSACKIMLIDIYMKLCGDSLNHFQVTEWTRFCDRQTDARGKKQYTSPYPKGRRRKYQNPSSSGRGYIAFGADLISTGVPIQGCVCGEGGGLWWGGGEYLEQNRFKNRHNWHARSNGGKKKKKQEDHDGPISLTWANSFAYLLLKFQPSLLL